MAFARSVSIVTIINIIGAMLSIVNVAVIAHFFGTSESIEIYFASTILLTTLLGLSNSAQISDVVLPIYHRVSHQHSKLTGRLVYAVIVNWAIVISLILVFLFYLFLPYAVQILVPGFSADAKLQVVSTMYWILPLLFFSILVQFFATFINAEGQFGRPELIALFVKVIGLACILLFAEKYDYWALVIGLWASMAFRMVSHIIILSKLGYRHQIVFSSQFVQLRGVARQFFSSSGYTFSSQMFQIALNAGVSQLPQGTFAIFTYVRQFSLKTSGIFLKPISLVFFTKASQIITKGAGDLASLCDKALSLFTLPTLPIILYMLVYGELFLEVLLGSKGIEKSQIAQGSIILEALFCLLLVAGLANIHRKILISSGFTELMYWSTSVLQLLSVGIVLFLVPAYGVVGVVAAISISSIINLAWLMLLVRIKLGKFYFYNVRKLFSWLLMSISVGSTTSFLLSYSNTVIVIENRLENVLFLGVHSIIFGILVLGFGLLFRVDELKWAFDNVINRAASAFKRQRDSI